MTFSRARPLGFTKGTTLTAAELNILDVNQSRAVDGAAGGTYNTSAKLTFEGTAGFRTNFSTVGLEIAGLGGAHVISGSTLTVDSGGAANVASGGGLTIESGGTFTGAVGSTVNVNALTVTNTSNTVNLASRSVTRVLGVVWTKNDLSKAAIGRFTAAIGETWYGNIDLPHGQTLTAISVSIQPGVHAGMPDVMPVFAMERVNFASGTVFFTTGDTSDPSANIGAYNPTHEFGFSGRSDVIDREANSYRVKFVQESGGANELNGFVIGVKVTMTVTSLPPVV